MLEGVPIQLIAADLGVNATAVYRHNREHIRTQLRRALEAKGLSTGVTDLAGRLAVLLDETEAVRERARSTNDSRLLLQAVTTEAATIETLSKRLGVDDLELLLAVREAQALVNACARELPAYPEAFAALINELSSSEHGRDLAQVLRPLLTRPPTVAPSVGAGNARSIQQHQENEYATD